jgi:hypothetical protein
LFQLHLEKSPVMDDDMRTVLRFLADHFRRPDETKLSTPFDVPGLSFGHQVAPALHRLAVANPPYIHGMKAPQVNFPVAVTGISHRGWAALEADRGSTTGEMTTPKVPFWRTVPGFITESQ